MVDYESDDLLPFPREEVWKLLNDHGEDSLIRRIHPLIREQRTVSRSAESLVVDRTIDARGKLLASQWKIVARPPESYRWEILSGSGPYAPGSWMESHYAVEGGNTRIRSRGSLKVTVVPFFIPQRPVIRRVLDTVDGEDRSYLRP